MELVCQAQVCAYGVGGARWKTPSLSMLGALLGVHMAHAHPGEGGGAAFDGGGGECDHEVGGAR